MKYRNKGSFSLSLLNYNFPWCMSLIKYYICMSPLIESFEGIRVEIYSREHYPPHVHAKYAGYEVVIDLYKLEILAGSFPTNKWHVLDAWLNREGMRNELITLFFELNQHLNYEKE